MFALGVALVASLSCKRSAVAPATSDAGAAASVADSGLLNTSLDGGSSPIAEIDRERVASALNPDSLPYYDGPTGVVEGYVHVAGDLPPSVSVPSTACAQAKSMWGTGFRQRTGPRDARALADAVVAVTGYRGFAIREAHSAKDLVIEGCTFSTRTLTLTLGQTIEVRNTSKDFWTPVLEPGPTVFLRMAVPGGEAIKLTPQRPGRYRIYDRDRTYAVVDVYTLLQPLHSVSGDDGHYRIEGVPAGLKLKVSTTHPAFDAMAEHEIMVEAGKSTRIDLSLKHTLRK